MTNRLRGAAQLAIAALTVAALVLAVLVWTAVAGPRSVRADVGEKVGLGAKPYGRELTVLLPGSEITLRVGDPLDTIEHPLLDVEYDDPRWEDQQDLAAPEGGRLVPLSWSTRALGGFAREGDPNPIEIRLLAGDQRVELTSVTLDGTSESLEAAEPQSVAVGVDGEPDLDDLAIEVEYEGLTQTARVATGEVDAGVAQALYDEGRSFTAGCTEVEDACSFAAEPGSPLRPDGVTLTASHVTLYPYDAALGWADEGTLWAGVRLQLFGSGSVRNAAGDYWFIDRQSAPVVALDGAKPVRREDLTDSGLDTHGRVVFRVDAGAQPRRLTVDQVLTLERDAASGRLPIRARLDLVPVD